MTLQDRAIQVVAVIAIAVTAAAGAVALLVPTPNTPILGVYESPQRVVNIQPLAEGGMLVVTGRRCVTAHSARVLTFRTFTRVDPGPTGAPRTAAASTRVIDERKGGRGCEPQAITIALPAGVTAGKWRVDGIDLAVKDGSLRVWYSEDFEVGAAR